jgi:4-amino-4-deoxy-L-arabinose transferase-like glycosyltransferase
VVAHNAAARLRTIEPLQALVAVQVGLILAMGLLAAATVDIFSDKGFGDEPSHVAYVQTVAEDHRLPVLDRDKISREVSALQTGRDPDVGAPPLEGLSGEQYEAFQPPLYYMVAAPVFLMTDNWFMKIRLLRALGVAFLLLAAFVMYQLARYALPDAPLIAFSAALTVLGWPGVLVMGATVSNASLEILAVCALVYALWRADSEINARWLLLAGVALGLGILTKFTVAAFGALLLVVVARHIARSSSERRWLVGLAALAIPLLLVMPWVVYNLDHYNAITPYELAKQVQAPSMNPEGINYGFGKYWSGLPDLFADFYPLEWIFTVGQPKVLALLFEFVKAAFFAPPIAVVAGGAALA